MNDQGKGTYQISFSRSASALAFATICAMIGLPAEIVVGAGVLGFLVKFGSGTPRQDYEAMKAADEVRHRENT
jgi:hypothetical protein